MNHLPYAASSQRRVLIVGANSAGREIKSRLSSRDYDSIDVVGVVDSSSGPSEAVDVLGSFGDVRSLVLQLCVDDVVIALGMDEHSIVTDIVLSLEDLPVAVRTVPDYSALSMYKTQAEEFGGIALMNLRAPAINSVQRLYKRMFDVVVSAFLIVVLSPVFLITAIMIRLDSKGSAFFFQERVGENCRRFKMVKFRSMVQNAEALQSTVNEVGPDGEVLHKKKDDIRVTRVGRFIRSTSIDELPQLFNVLIGDMSLVGPRPELPWLVKSYDRSQRRRFAVPQGITGWWQVNGRSDKPMHLNTDEDLFYINNYSLWLDLLILFRTPIVVLRGKGAF